jgi:hypothetical protein
MAPWRPSLPSPFGDPPGRRNSRTSRRPAGGNGPRGCPSTGYVTRFKVRKAFLDNYQVHQTGGQTILEYWIPAEDLSEFNANIIWTIEIIARYDSTASD